MLSETKAMIKSIGVRLRRAFGKTPMQAVMRELRARGVKLEQRDTVELFGALGDMHVQDYVKHVKSLDVWEYDSRCEASLRKNLPTASIKITDAFREVATTPRRFGLIVIDNPMGPYDTHCEHFDLFPAVLRIAQDDVVIILDVIPELDDRARRVHPYLFSPRHLTLREEFYGVSNPAKIAWPDLEAKYAKLMTAEGFKVEWTFYVKRGRSVIHYYVMKLQRAVKSNGDAAGVVAGS